MWVSQVEASLSPQKWEFSNSKGGQSESDDNGVVLSAWLPFGLKLIHIIAYGKYL
jgi:hypothetical protein